MWGKDAPAYVVGDRLIARYPVFRPNPNSMNKKDKWVILINKDIDHVKSVGQKLIEDLKKAIVDTNLEMWESVESNTLSVNSLKQELRIMGRELDRLK